MDLAAGMSGGDGEDPLAADHDPFNDGLAAVGELLVGHERAT